MNRKLIPLLFWLVSCASAPKPTAPVTSAIVFVPGYYGTALKERASGRRVFVTAGAYVFGSDSVGLHHDDLATPPSPELVTDGVLEKVRVVPGLYSVDVYGGFLTELERVARDTNSELVRFAYDWRQDLVETAKRLEQRVALLKARGVTDIQIVAHSMGCLVTAYYLGYGGQEPEQAKLDWRGADVVKKVVLMAGPYRGAFSLFRNMQTGAKVGSNTSYLPAEAVASLPASYQLLPMRDARLYDRDQRSTAFAIEDVAYWERLRLGLLKNQDLPAPTRAARRVFKAAQLARARLFQQRLDFNGAHPPESLRVLQLVGHGRPVVDSAYFDAGKAEFGFDTDDLKSRGLNERTLFRDGDGSVTATSARLPVALEPNTEVLVTRREHDRVFDDESFRRSLRRFLGAPGVK